MTLTADGRCRRATSDRTTKDRSDARPSTPKSSSERTGHHILVVTHEFIDAQRLVPGREQEEVAAATTATEEQEWWRDRL